MRPRRFQALTAQWPVEARSAAAGAPI